MPQASQLIVLGAGSWGTALAIHLARNGSAVLLWGHDPLRINAMQQARRNLDYLPDCPFPDNLTVTADLSAALSAGQDYIIAVPSHAFAGLIDRMQPQLLPTARIAWVTKGICPDDNRLLSAVVIDRLGTNYPIAVLSGPSFAGEVADMLPTAVTLVASDEAFARDLIAYFHSETFRVYQSDDLIGVQLCGAVKNVLAIATGISDGLRHGMNARAALITRGLAEMTRLGLAMGAAPETFMSLAGVGDLVLTCTDNQSRNRRFGLALGAGHSVSQALKQVGQVVEGLQNCQQVMSLATQYKIEMPIVSIIYSILYQGTQPADAVYELMTRKPGGAG